jgi:hypothetical protein
MATQRDNESRPEYLDRLFAGKVYTLDGEIIPNMTAWTWEEEIETAHAVRMARMPVGASMDIGGGAFATFTLCRTR